METGNLNVATSAYGDFFLVDNIMVYIKGFAGHTKRFYRRPQGHGSGVRGELLRCRFARVATG